METLTAEQITDRQRIVAEVDAAECNGCGAPVPADASELGEWFIDSHMETDSANPEGFELADIRCPKCW